MNHTDAVREIIKLIPESQEEFEEPYKTKTPFMVISVFTKQIKKLIYNKSAFVVISIFPVTVF